MAYDAADDILSKSQRDTLTEPSGRVIPQRATTHARLYTYSSVSGGTAALVVFRACSRTASGAGACEAGKALMTSTSLMSQARFATRMA